MPVLRPRYSLTDIGVLEHGEPAPARTSARESFRVLARGSGGYRTFHRDSRDLTTIAREISGESMFLTAAVRVQREACRLTQAVESLCIVVDTRARTARSVYGTVRFAELRNVAFDVANGGRPVVLANRLFVPIGEAPARAVLLVERSPSQTFSPPEIASVVALAACTAAALERLIRSNL
jgi:hypothetical protein